MELSRAQKTALWFCFLLEVSCVVFLSVKGGNLGATGLFFLLFAHFAACWTLAQSVRDAFPDRSGRKDEIVTLLIFGLSFTMPGLGMLTALQVLRIVRSPEPKETEKDKYIVGELEANDEVAGEKMGGTSTVIAKVASATALMHKNDPQIRRNVILSMRHLDPFHALPLLRRGLQDSDEEVRIYAQNILSRSVEEYETHIKRIERSIESGQVSTILLTSLGELYHELVYLDLITDEEVKRFYLEKSIQVVLRALDFDPRNSAIRNQLLRLYLKAGETERADICLKELYEAGYPEDLLTPWEIELHYARRDWPRFCERLKEAKTKPLTEQKLDRLINYWLPHSDECHASSGI